MFSLRRTLCFTVISLVLFSLLIEEAEGRRKILKGRRTITRRYKIGTAIPAWAIVVIVGISMALLGGILYFVMRKILIPPDSALEANIHQTAALSDSTYS